MRTVVTYAVSETAPYINWPYFFYAWGMRTAGEKDKNALRQEAERLLTEWEGKYEMRAVFALCEAVGDGDDILLADQRLPMLRQQHDDAGRPNLCLADFVRPAGDKMKDHIGLFAVTAGEAEAESGDDYRRMLARTLADRLAEAATERLHEAVRKSLWGYCPDEHSSMADLLAGHYQGIRPAVGYPSLPDMSLNFLLDECLNMGDIGIRLTENGMMRPHASVSGLMFAHPKARYFDVGTIGEDQLADYARRRNLPRETVGKFLARNLMKV